VHAKEFVYSASDNLIGKICGAIIAEAHQRIGLKVSITNSPSKRTLIYANEGKYDGTPCRIESIQKHYSNLVRVGSSHISVNSYVYTKELEFEVEGWNSLEPYTIGIHRGHKYVENNTQGMKIIPLGNDLQLVKMLNLGRIDVAVMLEMDALEAMKDANIRVKSLQPMLDSIPLYFHFHKKNLEYLPLMKQSIQEMVESGRNNEIWTDIITEELGEEFVRSD